MKYAQFILFFNTQDSNKFVISRQFMLMKYAQFILFFNTQDSTIKYIGNNSEVVVF